MLRGGNTVVITVRITIFLRSDSDVCPGDTVVFTCITDTGQLQWINDDGDNEVYYPTSQVNDPAVTLSGGIFVLKLINASNNTFVSTATAHNVSLNNDGVNITCNSDVNNPDRIQTSKKHSLTIGSTNL